MTSEIDIITPLENSIIKRAVDNEILKIRLTQLRDFAFDKHRQVDDSPREKFFEVPYDQRN